MKSLSIIAKLPSQDVIPIYMATYSVRRLLRVSFLRIINLFTLHFPPLELKKQYNISKYIVLKASGKLSLCPQIYSMLFYVALPLNGAGFCQLYFPGF